MIAFVKVFGRLVYPVKFLRFKFFWISLGLRSFKNRLIEQLVGISRSLAIWVVKPLTVLHEWIWTQILILALCNESAE